MSFHHRRAALSPVFAAWATSWTALAALATPAALAQERRVDFYGDTTEAEEFGTALCWLPDRHGDGVDELVVGAPGAAVVRILSGRDLALQFELTGEPGTRFGERLAVIADLDGDGSDDLAIGAPEALDGVGRIELRSSATGAPLGEIAGLPDGVAFGTRFTVLGDVDGDGASELAVALQDGDRFPGKGSSPPALALFSTPDGVLLAASTLNSASSTAAEFVAIGDRNHDGVRELAVVGFNAVDDPTRNHGDRPHSVTIVDGRNFSYVATWLTKGRRGRLQFPSSIAPAGDCDGDGIDDYVVSRRGAVDHDFFDPFESELWVISGGDGTTLRYWYEDNHYFAGGLASAGDIDGDGLDEIAVARHAHDNDIYYEVQMQVAILSVRTGAALRRIDGDVQVLPGLDHSPNFGSALAGGRDLNGDGTLDLIVGDSGSPATSTDGGVVAWDFRRDVRLAQRLGVDTQHGLNGGVTWCDDVDGDGVVDFAIGEVDWGSAGSVALRSGRDGGLLRRISRTPLDDRFGVAIEPLPDLDGDGVGDLAIGGRGVVEIRSPVSGALLQTLTTELDDEAVAALACSAPPGGPVELMAGQPSAGDGRRMPGRALLFDLTTSALLHRFDGFKNNELYGFTVASLGDVTGDGVGDWAIGAPNADGFYDRAGRVHVINGALRKVARQWFGSSHFASLGSSLSAVDDVDGDGFGELLLCEPAAGSDEAGSVRMIAGKSWRELLRIEGEPYERLGQRVAVVDDVNGDGMPELASTTEFHRGSHVRLHSLANGAELATIGPADDTFGWGLAATRRSASAKNGSGGPELAIVMPFDTPSRFDLRLGSVEWWSLPSLFLELAPQEVATDETVIGHVRGAPAGAFAGIYLEAIDGVPFEQFLDFGFCNATGTFRDWSVVPPGMSGLCWTLRGYAIGFDGGLTSSSAEELRFE